MLNSRFIPYLRAHSHANQESLIGKAWQHASAIDLIETSDIKDCSMHCFHYQQMFEMLLKFDSWLSGLRDGVTKSRLLARLRKVQLGNLGDIKPVGEGVFEMRIFYGAGYRLYFVLRGSEILVLLAGGDKSTQSTDIQKAIQLSKQV
jgi:putative addiction module killer protein